MWLDSPVEESDKETDETAPDGYQATIVSDQGWIDANVAGLPPLTLKHIHQYFISSRLCKERVTATKPFKRGYRLFGSKKVQGLSVHDVTSTSSSVQLCYPHRKLGHTKQPLQLTIQMGKLFMEAVPAITLLRHQESTCYPW